MSGTFVVSNRGPLTFRAGAGGALVARAAAGGLASSLHRLLAGSGTTWASVTMGAADREAVARGLMHEDGLDLVPVVIDDETYRQAYDVVANTTLWYCHHHLFDLPHRPRFDRYWRAAWEGYRAYNRAMADVVAARAGQGDAVFVQDYHFSLLGRMLAEARPDLRTVHFLHTPFAAPDMLGVLPDDVVAELLDGMAGYAACGFHCHQWEADFRGLLRRGRGRRGAAAPFVAPLGPDAGVLEEEAASPAAPRRRRRCGPRWAGGASSPGPTAWSPPRTSCAGCSPSRSCCSPTPSGAARWCTWRWRIPSRQGLAEYLAYAADVEHTADAHQPRLRRRADGWTPIVLSVKDDCARSLAALDAGRRAAGQPGARRPQPRGQGGAAAQRGRRRAGALAPGGRLGGAGARRWRRARGQPLRRRRHGRRAARGAHHGRAGARGRGAAALRGAVRGRTAADWWADQLAAAQR